MILRQFFTRTVQWTLIFTCILLKISEAQSNGPETVQQLSITEQSNNSITVSWDAPNGPVEFYEVLLNSSSSRRSGLLNKSINSHEFWNLTAGKIYTATVITKSGNFSQESEPVTNATYPNPPGSISIDHTTTHSISISWAPALWMENSDSFNYTVTISNSSWSREYNTITTSQNLTELTPGTSHDISVRTTGPFGLQSQRVEVKTVTRPETVQQLSITEQSNNSITVSWDAPNGNVQFYEVLLNSSSSRRSGLLNKSINSHEFWNLTAGKIYTATVITKSGNFSQESEPVTNATYPNPPGSISIDHTTTNSISISWAPALLMENSDSFNYTVTISNSSWSREYNTITTSQNLTELTPGTSHDISVRTTGPFGLQSQRVEVKTVTRPETVQQLSITEQSNNSITVSWDAPNGNVQFYEVLLNSSSSRRSGLLNKSINSHEFWNLTAGKIYTATVITKSGNFSQESEPVTNATYPNPPGSISIDHTTTNSISISWAPALWMENSDSFNYTVTISNSSWSREYNTITTSQNLTELTPGTSHNITVRTTGPFGLQSQRVEVKTVTRPETVQQLSITEQSNNSITVSWDAPNGNVQFYEVLLNSSSSRRSGLLNKSINSHEFWNLTAGKIYTATVITKSGNFSQESEPVTNATYPNPPGSISIDHTTTNSISISWAPALWMENSDSFNYTVTISNSSWSREYNTITTSQNLTELTPGTSHNITVRTTGPFGLQSQRVEVKTVTRPETVQQLSITEQSNNSITVSWDAPNGNVQFYEVLLNSSSSRRSGLLNKSINSHEFWNLTAGKIYTATVITKSGNFSQESEPVTNATYPNPPGSISIDHTTTNSISISWAPAPLMENSDSFNYTVTISNSSWSREYNTKITSQNLTELTPGTSHDISVRTTGPFGLQSQRVEVKTVTRPETVQQLSITEQSNNSITVSWDAPNGNVQFYEVLLNSSSSRRSGLLNKSINSHEFWNLTAGKIYTATVITKSGNFSQESEPVTNATYPNPPGSISIDHTTTNSISISWAPALWMENSDSFNYTVTISNSSWSREYNTITTSQNLTELTPGTSHNITVRTTGPFGLQSQRVEVKTVTRPETVQQLSITEQSNNSITVSWDAPNGNVQFYEVLLNSSSSRRSGLLNKSINSHEFWNLTAGKIYTATVITKSGNFSQESEPVTNATYPNPPGSISIDHTTTNSISISWAPAPLMENSDSFNYTVTISNSSWSREYNTKSTSQNLTELTPGTSHDISVRTTGPFGLQSQRVEVKTVTRPETVQQLSITEQSNNSITVSWDAPNGNVQFYEVLLNSSSSRRSGLLNKSINSHEFWNLTAGKIYTATVITKSGNFSQESEPVTNATYPNPPGSISIDHTTTNSISISCAPALLMENSDSFNYTVTISNSSWSREYNTKSTSQNLTELTPGTSHNITVRTTGPFGLQSQRVEVKTVTRPETVQQLSITEQSNKSITVSWDAPNGNVQFYEVLLNSSSSRRSGLLNKSVNSHEFWNLTAGKIYTATVITKSGNFSQESEPVTNATYPNPPGSISIDHTTTNSISISWAPALLMENSDSFNYTVTISNSSWSREYNTKSTSQNLTELTPGTSHDISVRTTGPFGLQSQHVEVKTVTRPETVQQLSITEQSNKSITVSWDAPNGNVQFYEVLLNSSSSRRSGLLNKSVNSHEFWNLTAGKIYTATVITKSGNFSQESEPVTNATYPNPPGSISIDHTTTNSISISWAPALLMENSDSFNYTVTISNSSWSREYNTKSTSQNLTELTPGTSHDISVRTTGPFGLQSQRVEVKTVTRPKTVQQLSITEQSNNSITVSWDAPNGNVQFYEVLLNSSSSRRSGLLNKSINSHEFWNLTAGKIYTATVITKSGNFSQESEPVTNATYPNPPGSISIDHTTTHSISISWAPAPLMENSDSFNYTVTISNSSWSREYNTITTSQNLTELTPGTSHNITVRTTGPFGLQSQRVEVNSVTRPETVQQLSITEQSNNSITVSWDAPNGNVQFYEVLLNSSSSRHSGLLNKSINSHEFWNLTAGKIYTATVITKSGNFSQESEPVTNATYPNPPGSISIDHTTTNSISIAWAPALWMENSDSFNYTVTISTSSWSREYNTITTSQNLTELTPGTSHDISVRTTGPFGLQSQRVEVNSVTNTMGLREDELKCDGPNRAPYPLLNLTWKNPKGRNTGFNVTVKTLINTRIVHDELEDTCNGQCVHIIQTKLEYDTEYNVTVFTVGHGKWGSVSKTCKTGVTEPPVVSDAGAIKITAIFHNKIHLSLAPNIFNSSNGLIEEYGILVSQSNSPNFTNLYLSKSYSDWEKNKELSYLSVLNKNGNTRSQMDWIDVYVGDGTERGAYRNGPLTPTKTYRFAIVTFTNLKMAGGRVDIYKSIYKISEFTTWSGNLPENPLVITTAVGATCGILILCLCIAIAAFILLKRRRSGRPSSDIPINTIRTKTSVPVRIEEFDAYYKRQCANSKCGFAEEYEDLKPVGTAQSTNTARAVENKSKNRYSNVLPYEPSRVKLSILGSQFDDYINANYIPGANSRKEFIACQGPLPATVNDFWRMIWEKNIRSIVMLTRCNEQGRVKCEQYWPPESKSYNNIIVTTTSEITLDDWTLRDFDVKNVKTAETRSVRQFHYTAWPDHGVPVTTELLINFRHLVREHMDQYSLHSPTVVHCSAGVGRTGTFIAIDRIIFQIERESVVDVFGIVYDMRMHRALMVQTEDQYVFLNQCALDVIKSRMGTNVDLIYQNTEAINIYENVKPGKL
ncbi:receptor-type tyrosine-protein phosphatase beta-like [Alosa sapidissima]|uniref:receptor-type tyrosine-protein phosphatase beta-like n=1 Tax=Alosa sapidissima TaxID=34773 RepID=UPI001C096404|nr:receptor-type tyrosine-protein phosphatase beta-like [Alosa sapidissima]